MKAILAVGAISVLMAGCSASPKTFYSQPQRLSDTSLCRSLQDTPNSQYGQDLAQELMRRGITDWDTCVNKMQAENIAITAVGILAIGTLAAVAGATVPGGNANATYGSVAWDEFYDQYGYLTWRCREMDTGQFTDDYRCGAFKSDNTWPGKTAY